MRYATATFLGLAALVGFATGPLVAALDQHTQPKPDSRRELLVLEVKNCGVCGLVREYIQPEYALSSRSREVPMRYVDISALDERTLGLKSRIDTLPTIVLMQDGREIDRISGYVAPDVFIAILDRMIRSAD